MTKKMEAHLHEETKLWSFVVLCQKQIKNARRKNKERNLTWRNSRGQQLLDIFRVLHGVHFIHTIYHFESQEVKSLTLSTVCKLELKRRSYGHLKTTAPSWAKISQLRNQLVKILQVVSQLGNHLQAHVCHFTSSNSLFIAVNQVAKSSPSCESSCEIISKLWNHLQVVKSQIQLAKWTISTCKIFTSWFRSCEIFAQLGAVVFKWP